MCSNLSPGLQIKDTCVSKPVFLYWAGEEVSKTGHPDSFEVAACLLYCRVVGWLWDTPCSPRSTGSLWSSSLLHLHDGNV